MLFVQNTVVGGDGGGGGKITQLSMITLHSFYNTVNICYVCIHMECIPVGWCGITCFWTAALCVCMFVCLFGEMVK